MESLFFELTVVLVLAGACALLIHYLKQPSILAYIIAGLILGPFGYWRLHEIGALAAMSQVGITLLLFMVGLELDISQIKKIGKRAVLAGAGQVLVTTITGFLICQFLGFSVLTSFYVGLALTFSSTIIVVKLLSEKRDLQSLYGRLVVGIFLTQDLVALVVLMILSSGSSATGVALWSHLGLTLVRGALLVFGVILLNQYIFPKLFRIIGKSDELLLVVSLAWALGLATFVQLPFMGFSLEIGGFLAGLSLSASSVHYEISARIRSLRDFFIIIFFIVLGSQLSFAGIASTIVPAIVLALFVLVGNPFIVIVILSFLGYKPRTSFFAAITVGQISEFSLILIALGLKLGHFGNEVVSMVTLVAIITFTVSSYSIIHADKLYSLLERLLSWFDFAGGTAELHQKESVLRNHIVLLGAHRTGKELAESFISAREKFLIVDFNPEVAEHYSHLSVPVICGDASDPYIQELAGFQHARMIVSTLPDTHDNLTVVESVRNQKLRAKLIIMAQNNDAARELYQHKVDYVLLPHYVNGIHLSKILKHAHPHQHLSALRKQHLKALEI